MSAGQDIEVPMELPSRANMEKNWRVRQKLVEKQRNATLRAIGLLLRRPPLPVNVQLVRVAPHRLDREDNLPMCMKAVKDAIADWLGLPDDRDRRARWFYGQQKNPKGKPRYQAVRIIVTPEHNNCAACNAPLVGGRFVG